MANKKKPNIVFVLTDQWRAQATGYAGDPNVQTPFRRYKHWTHEGGISTPLIVRWPDQVSDQGVLRDQPGQLTDIMATCLDVSGAEYPEAYDGHDVVAELDAIFTAWAERCDVQPWDRIIEKRGTGRRPSEVPPEESEL